MHLFAAIDDNFIHVWRGSQRRTPCSSSWLANTQRALDRAAIDVSGNATETQNLDIGVSREWLHVLAWQIGVSNGLVFPQTRGGLLATAANRHPQGMRLEYPVELARRVISLTSSASSVALDSHGIGMEQKLYDVSDCLADALRCIAPDQSSFQEGKWYLHLLLVQLRLMRGKESRYLGPLVGKVEGLMGATMIKEISASPAVNRLEPFRDTAPKPAHDAKTQVVSGGQWSLVLAN